MMKVFVFLFGILTYSSAISQVVVSSPQFPEDTESVVIIFDATQGTGGLADHDGDVYAHTGVITENSTSPSDWKYVKTDWGENTEETKLTSLGNNLYELEITPSIREYYGVPDDEKILQMSFVFRSADASKEGKGEGGSDIFVDLNVGWVLQVNSPTTRYKFYESGEIIDLSFNTPEETAFSYYVDDELVSETVGTSFTGTHQVISDQLVHKLLISAKPVTGEDSAGFLHTYIVDPETEESTMPTDVRPGINYHDDQTTATLVLTAPGKESVFVIGDFNSWSLDPGYKMIKDGDKFWLTIEGLTPGEEYVFQYLVDGEIIIADPYTEKVISQFDDTQIINEGRYPGLATYPFNLTEHEAGVLQTAKPSFEWEVVDFDPPARKDLVIYELLVRDFTEERTYQAVIDRLDYLDSLGINALQLMPVMEFEGNLSWGYNPAFKLAVDKFYGTEEDLKTLIDECHKRGIAVILDMVLNHHFGRSPLVRLYNQGDFGAPTSDNPWFNTVPKHPFNVGYDFNHESTYTQEYVDRVNTYWIEEYKIDGFRFDLSKGFTQTNSGDNVDFWGQYDRDRVALLKRMADVIWEADPENYVILEHFASNSEEIELANYGMMLWGNMHGTYETAGLGFPNDLDWTYYQERQWDEPNLVAYMESHDEERILFNVSQRSGESSYRQFRRMMQNAAFFFAIPGPKMLWQFGEFGYDLELNNDRLGVKPTRWEYLQNTTRLQLFSTYQAMINLKTQTDYLDEDYFSWESRDDVKWIKYDHPEVKTFIFGNFTKEEREFTRSMMDAGTWYNYLTGEPVQITDNEQAISYAPGKFFVYTSEPIDNFLSSGFEARLLSLENDLNPLLHRVYPNPTSDKVTIEGLSIGSSLKIMDLSGRLIRTLELPGDRQVSLAGLHSGVYLIKANKNGQEISLKVAIK